MNTTMSKLETLIEFTRLEKKTEEIDWNIN